MAAITPVILKNTDHEVVVKATGVAGDTCTIDISTLATANQTQSGTAKVNIAGIRYAGQSGSIVAITRGATTVMTYEAVGVDGEDFAAGWVDSQANDADLVLTLSGAASTTWLTLRKQEGFLPNIETGAFGAYDDETQAGV